MKRLVRNVTFIMMICAPLQGVFAEPSGVRKPTFERDIQPILTRAGCNAGACHGKARGQNGFALSLLGFDSDFDHDAIARDARGRRVFPASPEDSLLLRKATAAVPHGGGPRLQPGTPMYEVVRSWIASGLPRTPAQDPRLVRISVDPIERTVKSGTNFNMAVTAFFSDGSKEDVTGLAAYSSSESVVVAVAPTGQVKAGQLPGEASVSARFGGMFASCEVRIPLEGDLPANASKSYPRYNFIDQHVWTKLDKLGLMPSPITDDASFMRRAYIDVIGRLPNVNEAREFIADKRSNRRTLLVDTLLNRPEYADHWANKWVDLLRPNPYRVGIKAVFNLDGWIRDAFRQNMPYDQFVTEIVTAQGGTFRNGAATVFRDRREPEEIAPMVSQLFLGIRLECAKCHHHPFESWGQEQFYEFAGYFARVGRKGTGLSPPISGDEEFVFNAKSGSIKHPLTGKTLPPKPLFGTAPSLDTSHDDYRESLSRWMTSKDNPYFTRVIVNRVWADLMGKGIVDPVDDLRATNPPSNAPLLAALADDFRDHGYDLKYLIRVIMNSAVYQLDSEPNTRNRVDSRNFSRHYRQRLRAEVLVDAIADVTEVPDKFNASPMRSRAVTIWTHRVPSLFLDTFGRPDPNQDPPCERTVETSVVQALHLMNAPDLQDKLTSDLGRVARLAKSEMKPRAIAEELYLAVFGRLPTDPEYKLTESFFNDPKANRRQQVEDLLWSLLNSAEFVFKN